MNIPNLILALVEGQRMDESGNPVKVKEKYLVDAMTPTEAEARLAGEVGAELLDFSVSSTKVEKADDLFVQDAEGGFFKVVYSVITLDEKSGKEKRQRHTAYTRSTAYENAITDFLNGMKGSLLDFEIESIVNSHITDLITTVEVAESN